MLMLKVNKKIRHTTNIKFEQEYKTKYNCQITPTYTKLTRMFVYKDKLKQFLCNITLVLNKITVETSKIIKSDDIKSP